MRMGMKGKKRLTKAVALLICMVFLATVCCGMSVASAQGDHLKIYANKELNHATRAAGKVPGEIIVKFDRDVNELQILLTNFRYGTTVESTLPSRARVLKIPTYDSVDTMVKRYNGLPDVEYAEPNYIVRVPTRSGDTFCLLQLNHSNGKEG